MKAIDILLVVVAQKLKKRIDEIPLSRAIKDLVGKSTLQNEILGDLQQEFASAPEKGEEFSLEELGSALGSGFNGSLGNHSTVLVSRLVGGKMPGGFNAPPIKGYLAKTWGLGPSSSDGVLLLATTLEPPKRLASEVEAKAWPRWCCLCLRSAIRNLSDFPRCCRRWWRRRRRCSGSDQQ